MVATSDRGGRGRGRDRGQTNNRRGGGRRYDGGRNRGGSRRGGYQGNNYNPNYRRGGGNQGGSYDSNNKRGGGRGKPKYNKADRTAMTISDCNYSIAKNIGKGTINIDKLSDHGSKQILKKIAEQQKWGDVTSKVKHEQTKR